MSEKFVIFKFNELLSYSLLSLYPSVLKSDIIASSAILSFFLITEIICFLVLNDFKEVVILNISSKYKGFFVIIFTAPAVAPSPNKTLAVPPFTISIL